MRKYNWNRELLESTVKQSTCWLDWLRLLGIPTPGNNFKTLKAKAKLYNIDTSHFNSNYARTHRGLRVIKNREDNQIFSEGAPIKKSTVKQAYIDRILNGVPCCECCGIKTWNNKDIVFQLHHKDGNPKNHRIENLILLCPNCHSQTDNFSNKKRN